MNDSHFLHHSYKSTFPMAVCDCPVGAPVGPTLAATCGGSSFMLFMGLLEVFLRSQCDIEDPCNRPKVCTLVQSIPSVAFINYEQNVFKIGT